MYINLKPHEEPRTVSTLPSGVTMSIFNDTTQFHEISYEVVPPVLDNFPLNDPEEDSTVLDYYPHRTLDTRKKNKNRISTAPLHVSDEADSSTNNNQPMNLSLCPNLNAANEGRPSAGNISRNNHAITSMVDASDENLHIPKADTGIDVVTCDNDIILTEVLIGSNSTEDLNCNNTDNELNIISTIDNNDVTEDGDTMINISAVMTCDNDTAPNEVSTCINATKDMNCNNIYNKMATINTICNNDGKEADSRTNYKPITWNDAFLAYTYVNTDQCDISPLSLEDSTPSETCVKTMIPGHKNDILKNVSSSKEDMEPSRYDPDVSDISVDSDCSSHSCTTISSSDEDIVPTLVRVSKEIMDEIGNKECCLLLPKLPQLTIDFWKNRDNKSNSAKAEPDRTADEMLVTSTPNRGVNADHNMAIDSTITKSNIYGDSDHGMDTNPVNIRQNKFDDNPDSENTSAIEDHKHVNNTMGLSDYTSPSSESDCLINPIKTKTTRRVRKRINYSNMCMSSSSSDEDSDEDMNTNRKSKTKPSPGAAPSMSRL